MLSHTSVRTKSVAIAALFLAPAAACGVLVVPDGVFPGETYHYAFVTSGTRDATSTDIADYKIISFLFRHLCTEKIYRAF